MFTIKSNDIVSIIKHALNCVDSRLVDHGVRVSYIMSKILSISRIRLDKKLVYDICMLGLFHDVGAYKTDDIDDLFTFDAQGFWPHSVYGYLFIYHMSPLSHLAESVKLHHLKYKQFNSDYASLSQSQKIALLIRLCDRIDVLLSLGKTTEQILEHLEKYRDDHYPSIQIDLFKEANESFLITSHLFDKTYTNDSDEFLQNISLPESELIEYLSMLSLSIDFRSPYTVFHTITVVEASVLVAKLMRLDDETVSKIRLGALLHDIGKMGIPVSILEKPGSLDSDEMVIMRSHIDMTRSILAPYLDTTICEIASRHHERLDGSGYPQGLSKKDLTLPEMLLAVSDVISALKGRRSYKEPLEDEAILNELRFLADNNKLSKEVVQVCTDNFPMISARLESTILKITQLYSLIQNEYLQIMTEIKKNIFLSDSAVEHKKDAETKSKGLLKLL